MKRKTNNNTCTEVSYNIGPLVRQEMLDNHITNLKKQIFKVREIQKDDENTLDGIRNKKQILRKTETKRIFIHRNRQLRSFGHIRRKKVTR